jgi:YVTN family beta-propeller protein
VQKIPAGIDPDAIIDDQKLNLVYAGNHDGKTATLIDAATRKIVANIELGGEPEYLSLIWNDLSTRSVVLVLFRRGGSGVGRGRGSCVDG